MVFGEFAADVDVVLKRIIQNSDQEECGTATYSDLGGTKVLIHDELILGEGLAESDGQNRD